MEDKMEYICANCGEEFEGKIRDKERVCPECSSDEEAHIPMIFNATAQDQILEE
jgi:rubrerythrin